MFLILHTRHPTYGSGFTVVGSKWRYGAAIRCAARCQWYIFVDLSVFLGTVLELNELQGCGSLLFLLILFEACGDTIRCSLPTSHTRSPLMQLIYVTLEISVSPTVGDITIDITLNP